MTSKLRLMDVQITSFGRPMDVLIPFFGRPLDVQITSFRRPLDVLKTSLQLYGKTSLDVFRTSLGDGSFSFHLVRPTDVILDVHRTSPGHLYVRWVSIY